MSFSVNTNAGALVALQNLSVTQSDLQTTQNRINTGLKVASAKDNAAIYGIAQNQRATSSSLNSVISSLQTRPVDRRRGAVGRALPCRTC